MPANAELEELKAILAANYSKLSNIGDSHKGFITVDDDCQTVAENSALVQVTTKTQAPSGKTYMWSWTDVVFPSKNTKAPGVRKDANGTPVVWLPSTE